MKKRTLCLTLLLTGCGNGDSGFPSRPDPVEPQWQIPLAQLVTTDGESLIGSDVAGSYIFVDPNTPPRTEGNSELVWRDSHQTLLGQGTTLLLTSDMLDKRIAYCVTPVAEGTDNTRGVEQCSQPFIVRQPTGHPPEAIGLMVTPSSAITVGDTLTGSYTYQDADPEDREGSSVYSWRQDGVIISGAYDHTYTLAAAQQGKQVSFCVRPASVPRDPHSNPTVGQLRCSEPTQHIAAKSGSAPVIDQLQILGFHSVGNTLHGLYHYQDVDNDLEGNSLHRWTRDGSNITGATEKNYTLSDTDLGTIIGYCVTPVAQTGLPDTGSERCDQVGPVTAHPGGEPPTATTKIVVNNGDWPHVGAVLAGSYQYQPSTTARPEGNSVSYWHVDGLSSDQTCTTTPCHYTVQTADIGRAIQYCVIPTDTLGLSGPLQCSQVTGASLSLHGVLEYNRTLYAKVIGLTGSSHWTVDTSNLSGPDHNSNKTEPVGSFNARAYHIGTTLYAAVRAYQGLTTNAVPDLDDNGIIDNRDWGHATTNGTAPVIDARHFIGKEVSYCLQTTEYGAVCANASESHGPGNSRCTDASQCVTGGIYFDEVNPLNRGIAPVTRLLLAGNEASGNPIDGSAYLHRPLSYSESMLKDRVGLGSDIPSSASDGVLIQGGIRWSKYTNAAPNATPPSPALSLCRNLTDGDPTGSWSLPVNSNSYATDSHAAPNGDNQAPVSSGLNTLTAWQLRFADKKTPTNELDPVFGWPESQVWSATLGTSSTSHHAVNWQDGGNGAQWGNTSWLLVICIQ